MHLNFGPQAHAPPTLQGIFSSFREGSAGFDLRARPARRLKLQLMAPHSQPHFPSFLVFSSLTLPSSPHPAASPWGHAPQTLPLGERGPGGARTTGGPRESEVVPATPWAVGAVAASAGHGGKTAAAATTSFPYSAPETVGSDPQFPTNLQAGSRKAEAAALPTRPQAGPCLDPA